LQLETAYGELRKEINLYIILSQLKDTDATYISNKVKVLKEIEEMKRTLEHYEALIAG
jgi:hypothetical protein